MAPGCDEFPGALNGAVLVVHAMYPHVHGSGVAWLTQSRTRPRRVASAIRFMPRCRNVSSSPAPNLTKGEPAYRAGNRLRSGTSQGDSSRAPTDVPYRWRYERPQPTSLRPSACAIGFPQ